MGAEVLPSGWVGAERFRRRGLARITRELAFHGRGSTALLQRLCGGWVHCLQLRRSMMSLLWEAYRWIAEPAPVRAVRCLGRRLRSELAALATLAPLMQSDLSAQVSSAWICSDASEAATASAVAEVGERAAREAGRYRERQGYFARPLGEAASWLRARGTPDAQDLEEWTVPADQRQAPALDSFDVLWIGRPPPGWRLAFSSAGLRCGPTLAAPGEHSALSVMDGTSWMWALSACEGGRCGLLVVHASPFARVDTRGRVQGLLGAALFAGVSVLAVHSEAPPPTSRGRGFGLGAGGEHCQRCVDDLFRSFLASRW